MDETLVVVGTSVVMIVEASAVVDEALIVVDDVGSATLELLVEVVKASSSATVVVPVPVVALRNKYFSFGIFDHQSGHSRVLR